MWCFSFLLFHIFVIEVLPKQLQYQISAGEVIERPASVLKELVENSLDAGATRVEVALWGGGMERLVIVDNGSGMDEQDAERCFERYATSKLRSVEDLFKIQTLGFRGEALASIAAVSEVVLETRTADAEVGTRLRLVGGEVEEKTVVAMQPGTSITVSRLFFNTPARKKFLKNPQTETRHCAEVVHDQALIHPELSFQLRSESREYYDLPMKQLWAERISQVLGSSWQQSELLPVDFVAGAYKLSGFVGKPQAARAGRQHQHLFVNQRRVEDYLFGYRIKEAMGTLVAKKLHPMYVLNLDLPPGELDVNVHPRKAEIKFLEPKNVYEVVEQATVHSLQQARLLPGGSVVLPPSSQNDSELDRFLWGGATTNFDSTSHSKPDPVEALVSGRLSGGEAIREEILQRVEQQIFQGGVPTESDGEIYSRSKDGGDIFSEPEASYGLSEFSSGSSSANQAQQALSSDQRWQQTKWEKPENQAEQLSLLQSERFTPLIQLYASYILAEGPKGLVLVDQHAAQERVMFERFSQKFAEKGLGVDQHQDLLLPEHLELTWKEKDVMDQLLPLLSQWGFELEPFGEREYVLRSIPSFFAGANSRGMIEGLIDQLMGQKKLKHLDEALEKKLILKACKISVKANEALDVQQMQRILDDLLACEVPYTCPHGRPTIIDFSREMLEKLFHRR